jgi:iron-sulfur cluster assembly protein
VSQIGVLLGQRAKPALGVRLSLRTKGCSGMAYALTYVDEVPPKDEVIEQGGVRLYVDPAAVLFVIGTEMDYNDDPIAPGFVFKNPNEKARCGCGQSFHV